MGRFARQSFRTQAGVSEDSAAFSRLAIGRDLDFVGMRHGAGSVISSKPVAVLQGGPIRLETRLIHGGGDVLFHFRRRIFEEGIAEVLHNIDLFAATNYAQPDDIVGWIQQVGAMRR